MLFPDFRSAFVRAATAPRSGIRPLNKTFRRDNDHLQVGRDWLLADAIRRGSKEGYRPAELHPDFKYAVVVGVGGGGENLLELGQQAANVGN